MKKITALILISLITFFSLIDCSNNPVYENGSGKIVIKTPNMPSYPFKTISSDYNVNINTAAIDPNNFRYDVIIENKGKRLQQIVLKNDDKISIGVPAGIPLDIYIGLYCAQNNNTYNEKYNVYLASDKKNGVVLMADDTDNLEFSLDLTKKTKVTTYYNNAFGSDIAGFTGGVYDVYPYFSLYPLENYSDSRIIQNNSGISGAQLSLSTNGRGVLSEVIGSNYWYVDNNGIYHTNNMTLNMNNYNFIIQRQDLLSKTVSIRSCSVAGTGYYFINHIDGYFGLIETAAAGFSSGVHYADMSGFSNLYPSYPYIIDTLPYSFNNSNMAFIATKTGLFLIDTSALNNYASGKVDAALAGSNKLIRIVNPIDNSNVLITNIEIYNNVLYLGTTQGLYYLNMTGNDWNNFRDPAITGFKVYDQGNIKKYTDFKTDEPIIYMNELIDNNANTILVASTNKRIFFKNMTTNRNTVIDVWDGLPFVPIKKFNNTISLNNTDFRIHDAAQIRFLEYDAVNNVFWIGTDFGLGSISYNELF